MRPICLLGRLPSEHDLKTVRDLIADNPRCGRTALSLRWCQLWDWRNHAGRLKDMAARTLLPKLHARELIALPPPKRHLRRPCAQTALSLPLELPAQPGAVQGPLAALQPVRLELAHTAALRQRTRQLLGQHHDLGFHGAVGENVQYLIRDARGAELAVMVFGAAVWKMAARDRFIGWAPGQRQQHLGKIAHQQRYIIRPRQAPRARCPCVSRSRPSPSSRANAPRPGKAAPANARCACWWRRHAKRPSGLDPVTLLRQQLAEKPMKFTTAETTPTYQNMVVAAAA